MFMACLLLSVLNICTYPAAEVLQEQKWIIAVLFMVPVYASESVSTSSACSDAQSRQRNAITRSSHHFASIENYLKNISV
jgi:hypothetical protein